MTDKYSQETPLSAVAGSQPKQTIIAIEGGIWRCAPVAETPSVLIEDWAVYEVQLANEAHRTRHFVGTRLDRGRTGRVSSAIVTFDPLKQCGVTESGRVYELIGRGRGPMPDAEYVWNAWRGINGATDIAELTAALCNGPLTARRLQKLRDLVDLEKTPALSSSAREMAKAMLSRHQPIDDTTT